MSSSSILRPEILVIGNRSYRINPSSLPSLESIDNQQNQVYREEEEADYQVDNLDDDDDEPSCKPQQKRTIGLEEKPHIGISQKICFYWKIEKDYLVLQFHRARKIQNISF